MKGLKIITFGFFLVIYGLQLQAQHLSFGALAGVGLADFNITTDPKKYSVEREYTPLFSYNLNAHIGYKSKSFWGISIEPGYIRKGERQNYYDSNDQEIRSNFIVNYINIPLLADFYVGKRFQISAGPEFAMMINAIYKSEKGSSDITYLTNNKFDVSGVIGVSYLIGDKYDIGLRYNRSFIPVIDSDLTDKNGITIGEISEYSQCFQLFFRFRMSSGKKKS